MRAYRLIKLFLILCACVSIRAHELPICFVIPSYNNSNYFRNNLDSIIHQEYTNWSALYIDDCSTDGTADAVQKYIEENKCEHKIRLIRNKKNMGAMANIYNAVHLCDDKVIIILVDGDDRLAHTRVLERINQAYSDGFTWMTYGQYTVEPIEQAKWFCGSAELPAEVIKNSSYRTFSWYTGPLRTFYAGLFKKIDREDFMYQGAFLPALSDPAFMFPLLEMAGEHSTFIPDILYVYNRYTQLSDSKVRPKICNILDNFLRKKRKYERLPDNAMDRIK